MPERETSGPLACEFGRERLPFEGRPDQGSGCYDRIYGRGRRRAKHVSVIRPGDRSGVCRAGEGRVDAGADNTRIAMRTMFGMSAGPTVGTEEHSSRRMVAAESAVVANIRPRP
jgi:hypothetical protein